MSLDSHATRSRLLHWPLWGVLITGCSSSLLWEHGEILNGHLVLLLICLIALPVAGGALTLERPSYTVVVFAVGSYPPLNDIPPVPMGLWPFARLWENAGHGEYLALVAGVFGVVFMTALAAMVMSVPFLPLVYFGWTIRCLVIKKRL